VTGVRFPVRVDKVGRQTMTVKGTGGTVSDAVARAVLVVPDGQAVPVATSGALAAGTITSTVNFPTAAVAGSPQIYLNVYPAYLSQVIGGMDALLRVPIRPQEGGRGQGVVGFQNTIMVTLGLPPGFQVATADFDAYKTSKVLSAYEITGKQLMLYLSALPASGSQTFKYHLQATMPVIASDGGAEVYLYYQPKQRSAAAAVTLQVVETPASI
jgi:hypothetical protein